MRLKRGLKLRKIGSQYMIVDSQGEVTDLTVVYTLNGVAARLWQKASEEEFSEKLLAEWLCGEYEVVQEKAAEDVRTLLAQWKEYGLLDE